jgi:transcriptional regulator of acetoin/glycerol metabolism
MVRGLAPPVLELFQKYSWPGNIRQLQNVIRQAVFKGRSDTIRLEDLPYDFVQKTAAPPIKLAGNYHLLIQAYSRRLLVEALQQHGGNRQRAATLLGVSRAQIYKLVKMHGLDGERGTGAAESGLEWLQ